MKKILFIIVILSTLLLSACSQVDPRSEDLVACMAEKDVKFYGAFWCGHCADQKAVLGDVSSIYIECDARGKNEQSELCIEKEIQGYPTFEFANGTMVSGVQTVEELAQLSECEI